MARDIVITPPHGGTRPGRLAPLTHVLVYLLLVGMVAVDYYLLSQTLTLLLRNDSQYGSIGALMYIITAGISGAVVTLPHLIAILIRRVESGITTKGWAGVAIVLGVLWVAILATVTLARIKAGMDAQTSGTLSGLVGESATPATATFSWTAPDTIMAFLMLGVLLTSGCLAFVTAWLTTRPLVTAIERARRRVTTIRRYRDRLLAERVKASESVGQQAAQDAADLQRYTLAQATLHSDLEQVRARLATRLAQFQRDPQGTSQIIHELQLREATTVPEVPSVTAPSSATAATAPSAASAAPGSSTASAEGSAA